MAAKNAITKRYNAPYVATIFLRWARCLNEKIGGRIIRDGKSHRRMIECSLSKNGMRIGSETMNRTVRWDLLISKVEQQDEGVPTHGNGS